jgi:hypothetical protein
MKKSLVLAVPALAAAAALLSGCFDVEESVSLQRNLSGRAGFSMTVDMEPMIEFMAEMQHSMSGKTGEVTPQELAQERQQFLDKRKSETGTDPAKKQKQLEEQKADTEKKLPPGVKLLSMSVDDQGLKLQVRAEFAFDDIRKLAQIDLPSQGKGSPTPEGRNPYDQPFGGLKVVDEGPTLLLTLTGANPSSHVQDQAAKGGAADPGMQKTMETALKNARFAFKLDSPMEVVTTNAMRRDGQTLYWEVRVADPVKPPDTLMARFKK